MAEWTTEDVRYEVTINSTYQEEERLRGERFDRWLATHDAEVIKEAVLSGRAAEFYPNWMNAHDAEVAAKALEDAADEFENRYGLLSGASVRARAAALRGGGLR